MSTVIVGSIVFFILILAAFSVYKTRKKGSCGGCSACGSKKDCSK